MKSYLKSEDLFSEFNLNSVKKNAFQLEKLTDVFQYVDAFAVDLNKGLESSLYEFSGLTVPVVRIEQFTPATTELRDLAWRIIIKYAQFVISNFDHMNSRDIDDDMNSVMVFWLENLHALNKTLLCLGYVVISEPDFGLRG